MTEGWKQMQFADECIESVAISSSHNTFVNQHSAVTATDLSGRLTQLSSQLMFWNESSKLCDFATYYVHIYKQKSRKFPSQYL